MSLVVAAPSECPNCSAALSDHYCAACGQKVTHPDPTLHDLWHEFVHEVLHVDGKIFQSIKLLYVRPGFLTKEFCSGRRVRHVGPLRLYLTFSVLAFALMAMEPPPKITVAPPRAKQGIEFSTTPVKSSGIRIDPRLGISGEEAAKAFQEASHIWLPRALFLLVPVAALLVKLLTRKTRRRFPQHLYFALHIHAAYFGLLALTLVPSAFHIAAIDWNYSNVRVLLTLVYLAFAFRTVYGGSWLRSAWRSGALMVSYMFIVLIVLATILVWSTLHAARLAAGT